MVSLAKGDSSCTLVNWFIAKFCMFFTGRHGQTKTFFRYMSIFSFQSQTNSMWKNSRFVFVCHAFHLVLCSLFRLPGQSIAPICNQFQVLCVAISSRFRFGFQPFFRFQANNHFFQFHRILSRGSRLAVSNIYSLSSGLIHLPNNSSLCWWVHLWCQC